MKKILFVATEPAPGMIPFVGSILNTLFQSKEIEVYCFCVINENRTFKKSLNSLVLSRTHFYELPKQSWKKAFLKLCPFPFVKKIVDICAENRIDTVHYLTGEFTLAIPTLIFMRNKYKLYYTVHNLFPHQYGKLTLKDSLLNKYINWGNKINLRSISNITTSSLKQYEDIKVMYPNKNIFYTSFPTLVTSSIAMGTNKVKELDGIKDYILFFGSVSYYKGVDLLLKAHAQYCNDTYLVVAGKGNLENSISHNVVRINRFIADEELRDLFQNAKLVVYPYRTATMSGVLSLAYYFRCQILVSNIPFFMSTISENTMVFNNGDLYDLGKKMNHLLSNKKAMIDADYYDTKYSKEKLLNEYIQLYKD